MTDTNNFYNDFDYKYFGTRLRDSYRSAFQVDRDRIIHTSAFRRLQSKTQVFLSGEYDFYRTRLTHSLEVAQIGRSICNFLFKTSPLLSNEYFIDSDLVEAICLAHDIGHPPFGHAGERALNKLMQEYGGFEGNAQTLRLLTKTIYSDREGRFGMSPTRAFMDGVMKYKTLYNKSDKPKNHFIYEDQSECLDFLGIPILDANLKSIECQIMDWADDTAYSIYDLVDGLNAGFINVDKLERWGNDNNIKEDEGKYLEEIIQSVRDKNINRTMAIKIGEFITKCSLEETSNSMSPLTRRYAYNLSKYQEILQMLDIYKNISIDLIFKSASVQQLEYKEELMLNKIFDAFEQNYILSEKPSKDLLPDDIANVLKGIQNRADRARIICDYIAGMTDRFAVRTYKRLYDPDFGSIVDLI